MRHGELSSSLSRVCARGSNLTRSQTIIQCKAWFQYQRKKKKRSILMHDTEVLTIENKHLQQRIEAVRLNNINRMSQNEDLRRGVERMHGVEQSISNCVAVLALDNSSAEAALPGLSPLLPDDSSREEYLNDTIRQLVDLLGVAAAEEDNAAEEFDQNAKGKSPSTTLKPLSSPGAVSYFGSHVVSPQSNADLHAALIAGMGTQLARACAMIGSADRRTHPTSGRIKHHASAVQVRALLTTVQNGNALDHLANSMEEILTDHVARTAGAEAGTGEGPAEGPAEDRHDLKRTESWAHRESALRHVLESFVSAEIADRKSQAEIKCQILCSLPTVPIESNRDCPVCANSMFCVAQACYLGPGERSMYLMGELSLYALLHHAVDFLNLSREAEETNVMTRVLLKKIQDSEVSNLDGFERVWRIPYSFTAQHHEAMASSILYDAATQCCYRAEAKTHASELLAKVVRGATETYNAGLLSCLEALPTVMCAQIFTHVHKVRTFLRSLDEYEADV